MLRLLQRDIRGEDLLFGGIGETRQILANTRRRLRTGGPLRLAQILRLFLELLEIGTGG